MFVEDKEYIKRMLRPKKVSISVALQVGCIFKSDDDDIPKFHHDGPKVQDSELCKQIYYHLIIANLRFAATWEQPDISFAASPLARFKLCASAGSAHWAALHHLGSRSRITGVQIRLIFCLFTRFQIGATALFGARRQAS